MFFAVGNRFREDRKEKKKKKSKKRDARETFLLCFFVGSLLFLHAREKRVLCHFFMRFVLYARRGI